jgi:hypothetical protein
VKGTVALLQGCSRWIHELAEGVLQRFRWEVGVQPRQRVPQALVEDHLTVIPPLGEEPIRGELRPVLHLPAQLRKPSEGGAFDGGFGER